MLMYNLISKSVSNIDPLNRWNIVHIINSLKNQTNIKQDCVKQLIPLTLDSNPYIRRMSLLTITNFIKTTKISLIENNELTEIICNFFSDPHPIVYGTAFHVTTELKNRDYINLTFPENFKKFCNGLIYLDEFFFSRAVFSLVNFSKIFLFNNIEKNFFYIKLLFDALYTLLKKVTDFSKNITLISAIYELIVEIDKQKLNVLLKEEFNIFKNKKRLRKIANILIRLYMSSKNKPHQQILILDVIVKFVGNNDTSNIKIFSENFEEIKNNVQKYVYQGIFYIKITDKAFIAAKKLKILINLVNEENVKFIFDEFKRNLNFPNDAIKKLIIKAVYFICKLHTENLNKIKPGDNFEEKKENVTTSISNNKIPYLCVEKLIDSLKIKEEEVISEVIICLRKLANEIKNHTKYILIYSIKNFKKSINSGLARANIIWMITQYLHLIPTVAVDFFRRMLIDISTESDEVKSQLIGLAQKLYFSEEFISKKYKTDSNTHIEKLKYLINYALEKLFYDPNYNIREKARFAQLVISSNNKNYKEEFSQKDQKSIDKINQIQNEEIKNCNFSGNYFNLNINPEEVNKEIKSETEKKENEKSRNFNLSLAYKMGIYFNANKTDEENEEEKTKGKFENLFYFDFIDSHIDENFFTICLDDIINLRKGEMKIESGKNNTYEDGKNLTDKDKFQAVKSQEEKVKNTVVNFDSDLNIEEKRNKLKNQLDDFLNDDNDEEEDEFEVEISKD